MAKEKSSILSIQQKERICAAVRNKRHNHFGEDVEMANFLNIHTTTYHEVFNNKKINVNKMSDEVWLSIAVILGVDINSDFKMKAAETLTFMKITELLTSAREDKVNAILSDMAGIGKTFAAQWYARENKHVAYIDCTQFRSKKDLIAEICRNFGLNSKGTYKVLFNRLKLYVRLFDNPLVILDETADLPPKTFFELKALMNATKDVCAWFLMGASGVIPTVNKYITDVKLGAEEVFRRLGDKYQKVTRKKDKDSGEWIDMTSGDIKDFLIDQIIDVAEANGKTGDEARKMAHTKDMTLSRLEIELKKEYKKGKKSNQL